MPVGVTFNDCAPVYVLPGDQLAIVRLLPDREAGHDVRQASITSS